MPEWEKIRTHKFDRTMSNEMANSTSLRENITNDTLGLDDKNNNNFRKRKIPHQHSDVADHCCETEVNNRNRSLECSNDAGIKPVQQQQSTSDMDSTNNHSGNLNFGVDRILDNRNSFNGSQLWPSFKVNDSRMDSITGAAAHQNDEFKGLYRPMPVRYLPNTANFPGKCVCSLV